MKAKTLKKKIRRLETRLREGPKKLAKLKRKLEALVKANESGGEKKRGRSSCRRAPGREAHQSEKNTQSLTRTSGPTCGSNEGAMGRQASGRCGETRRNFGES